MFFLDLAWFLPVRFCFAPILAQVKKYKGCGNWLLYKEGHFLFYQYFNIFCFSLLAELTYSPSDRKLGLWIHVMKFWVINKTCHSAD